VKKMGRDTWVVKMMRERTLRLRFHGEGGLLESCKLRKKGLGRGVWEAVLEILEYYDVRRLR